jgi:membrane-anchored mycosin MYCP
MTARQVMQRIESTAHHPPAGWDPVVGNGAIDALAAVSTDSTPAINTSKPGPAPVPIPSPLAPATLDRQGRNTALGGAAICLLVLVAALVAGAVRGRLRRSRHSVPSD